MKLYREVKASERLPKPGMVLTARGMREYNGSYFINYSGMGTGKSIVESWLEPTEITEEEIDKEKQVYEVNSPRYMTMMVTREAAFKAGVKWALSKLKGE